jgi:hypothetical protein
MIFNLPYHKWPTLLSSVAFLVFLLWGIWEQLMWRLETPPHEML